MNGAAALLERLPPWVLVVGKGGVGKTTCAAALSIASAEHDAATLVLSTDPARALGDALGMPLGGDPLPVTGVSRLSACQLDAAMERDRFLARWRDVLVTIVDRGTYLERDDVAALVDGVLPGVDEAMALLRLADLATDDQWRRIIVDTAPTGHTLRLLDLPGSFALLLALLDAMQDKHRFMVRALVHRYRADDADAFLTSMRARVASLSALLADGTRCAALLVTRDEPVVMAESVRYARALGERGIAVTAVVVNAVGSGGDVEALTGELRAATPGAAWRWARGGAVELGVEGARGWGERLVVEAWGAPPQDTIYGRHSTHPPPNLRARQPLIAFSLPPPRAPRPHHRRRQGRRREDDRRLRAGAHGRRAVRRGEGPPRFH